MFYISTALEDWITLRYIKQHIKIPQDINIASIAQYYGIYIHRKAMPARYDVFNRYRAIVIDNRTTIQEQKEQFFHELCHILRHVGHQTMMPDAFRELQEWDAERFTMYATLPYYMLKHYDFENPYIVNNLSHDFKVTEELCIKRLQQIKRNQITNISFVAESKSLYNKV